PTEVETNTATPSVTSSATPTSTMTATPTVTSSATNRPTATRTPTATPSHTSTPRPTSTNKPTSTSTATSTTTPSRTPTATSTSRPSATSVEFDGILATPTLPASPTAAAVSAATRTPASCLLPRGWTTYRVQPGDTLFAISLATNSTVDELRYANCIDDVDNITSEDRIFVPRAPLRPVSTFVPVPVDARPDLAAFGCADPRVQITSPGVAMRLSGSFTVMGTATREDFGYYKIEIRPDWAEIYNFYLDSYTPVQNGSLGVINSEIFGSGLHWIRLTVVDARAGIPAGATCEIPVIFE
ncbi:MAG: LysM peptidoglycan-binding domain-containing protein, partial [Anaerolineae bacterium]|nr:LysM peptidoglycan-binding domain-containing protein [Anaerolineae bacterium]